MDTPHGHICCVCPLEPHIALILGISEHSIPLSATSPHSLLFLNLGIYGLVHATVGIGSRINLGLLRRIYKGGGGLQHTGWGHGTGQRVYCARTRPPPPPPAPPALGGQEVPLTPQRPWLGHGHESRDCLGDVEDAHTISLQMIC